MMSEHLMNGERSERTTSALWTVKVSGWWIVNFKQRVNAEHTVKEPKNEKVKNISGTVKQKKNTWYVHCGHLDAIHHITDPETYCYIIWTTPFPIRTVLFPYQTVPFSILFPDQSVLFSSKTVHFLKPFFPTWSFDRNLLVSLLL